MKPVALEHASRLVNHGPTVLVCTAHAGRRNVMAAAWSMPVEFTPPRIAVVIDKSTWTAELARQSGMLALCVPGAAIADLVTTVGQTSGASLEEAGTNKFIRYGIAHVSGPVLGLPLVAGCSAWMECRVIPEPHTQQAYDTWFVEVVSAQADERIFCEGRWQVDEVNADLHTLHHLGAGTYAVAGQTKGSRRLG
jgi:flavin reductase (DIM6/NTAB) family NADH-FMN oxidoreductase RutF